MKKFDFTTINDSEKTITSYVIAEHNISLSDLFKEFSFLNNIEFDIPSDCNLHFFINNSVYNNAILQKDDCILIIQNKDKYYIFHATYRHLKKNSSIINYNVETLYDAVLPKSLMIPHHIEKVKALYHYDLLQELLPKSSTQINRYKI